MDGKLKDSDNDLGRGIASLDRLPGDFTEDDDVQILPEDLLPTKKKQRRKESKKN